MAMTEKQSHALEGFLADSERRINKRLFVIEANSAHHHLTVAAMSYRAMAKLAESSVEAQTYEAKAATCMAMLPEVSS